MDVISRQAAVYAIDEMSYAFNVKINAHWALIKALADLPSAERHGRWIDVESAPHNLFYATCSVCGDRQTIEVANYCPMCGARMDEVSECDTCYIAQNYNLEDDDSPCQNCGVEE